MLISTGGNSPMGANCLRACVETPAIDYSSELTRGIGHAHVGTTYAGVNGLYDIGINVWE
jgi:formylglycine-generating enzyme required for sulfatase activity